MGEVAEDADPLPSFFSESSATWAVSETEASCWLPLLNHDEILPFLEGDVGGEVVLALLLLVVGLAAVGSWLERSGDEVDRSGGRPSCTSLSSSRTPK